jgi:hypothetical protein
MGIVGRKGRHLSALPCPSSQPHQFSTTSLLGTIPTRNWPGSQCPRLAHQSAISTASIMRGDR